MSQLVGGETESLLPHALARAERLEVAASFVAKVVALELADITLSGEIDPSTQENLAAVAQKLMDVSGLCQELVVDIAGTAGLEIETENPDAVPVVPPLTVTPLIPESTPASTNGHRVTSPTEEAELIEPERSPAESLPPTSPPKAQQEESEVASGSDAEATATRNTVEETASPEGLTGEVLYQGIVNTDLIPSMKPKTEQFPIMISGAKELRIKGNIVQLGKHEVFLLNALLILREEPRTARELKELGFYPDASNPNAVNQAFYQGITKLIEKVNQASGREIIKKLGERMDAHYVVNPDLVLIDMRDDEELTAAAAQPVKKK